MSHKLTPKQIKAVYLLVGGKSTIEVGAALKLQRETLSRWKRIPEFHLELERVTREMCDDMKSRLTCLVGESIEAVSCGINTSQCSPHRLNTAFSVLKLLGIDRMLVSDTVEMAIKRHEIASKFK